MSDEREVMAWDELGEGARDIAERIHGDGFEPDVILAIARGNLLVAGARRVRLRVAQDVGLDHLPVERSAAGHRSARPVGPPGQRLEQR